MNSTASRIQVIDSHTAGEPTRVVISGGPELGQSPIAQRLTLLREKHDWLRSAVVNEPRGSDVMVGALLLPPTDPANAAAVIFFNNVGYLNMCGHGAIGVAATLAHLGRLAPGQCRLETTVGVVTVTLHDANTATIENVHSYRHAKSVSVNVPGVGTIHGDVAWGGNWFFLVEDHGQHLTPANVEHLTDFTWRIRQALVAQGITGASGAEIDHVELFAPPTRPDADGKNFVLCPGKAYDRSPCGTGTSAKVACLVADGKLKPGQTWRQESIIGSLFEASARIDDQGRIFPRIKGQAYVNAESTILINSADPYRFGIRV